MTRIDASQRQKDYIADLVREIEMLVADMYTQQDATAITEGYREAYREQVNTADNRSAAASDFINRLKSHKRDLLDARKSQPDPTTEADAPEGFHILDGTVYKVQIAVHGSGRPYAKELVLADEEGAKGSWQYRRGAVSKLSEDTLLTLEEAQEFGRLYGVCARCGLPLTDEESIARGLGPICASKL